MSAARGKLVVLSGMLLGQFMAVLDVQVVASSLAQIQSGTGASLDEIASVQSSYLIAETVAIPLATYLCIRLGEQRLFIASCGGFTLISALAGFAWSLDSLVVLRFVQGFIGGAMLPTVLSYAFTTFDRKHTAKLSVVLSLVATLGPSIGPTLGGLITDSFGWRWLFYINVIPGVAACSLAAVPIGPKAMRANRVPFDKLGFVIIGIFLFSTQFMFEKGQKYQWFESNMIVALATTDVIALLALIASYDSSRRPLLDFSLFRNPQFSGGLVMICLSGVVIYGGTYLIPVYLETIRNYSAPQVGVTMLVSGVTMLMTGLTLGRVVGYLPSLIPMVGGFGIAGYGFALASSLTSEWGFWQFALVQACRGIGVMVAAIVAQTMCVATLRNDQVAKAAGFIYLARNLGGAFGLAMLSTFLIRQTSQHQMLISVRIADIPEQVARRTLADGISTTDDSPIDLAVANATLSGMVEVQARSLAIADLFGCLCVACWLAAAVPILLQVIGTGAKKLHDVPTRQGD